MNKKEAALFFGNQTALARGVGLGKSSITEWPSELKWSQSDRVIGAAVRLGKLRLVNDPLNYGVQDEQDKAA